jgi:hypothetical protein
MVKHTHQFMRVSGKHVSTWRCALDGCKWFVHQGLAHVIVGKRSICWKCGEQFTMTEESMQMDMPECEQCTLGVDIDVLDAFLKEKGIK